MNDNEARVAITYGIVIGILILAAIIGTTYYNTRVSTEAINAGLHQDVFNRWSK